MEEFFETHITKLSLGNSNAKVNKKNLEDQIDVAMWVLALPMTTDEDNNFMFYVITNTWKERNFDPKTNTISFVLPKIKCQKALQTRH